MKLGTLFNDIVEGIKGAQKSQMFGKLCYKANGKSFMCLFNEYIVFKLKGDIYLIALNIDGAVLFDPSGKGRAMKEWVQVPTSALTDWKLLALSAFTYVKEG